MNGIENRKNTVKKRWDFVGMFTRDCKCVSACACVCVGYKCILLCGLHIVYVKVQTQRVVLTGYKLVGVSYFGYLILFLYVQVTIAKEENSIIYVMIYIYIYIYIYILLLYSVFQVSFPSCFRLFQKYMFTKLLF